MKNKKAEVLISVTKRVPTGLWIEIGCIREDHEVPTDGFSTVYLAREAQKRNCILISIDKDKEVATMANRVLVDLGLPACVRIADGKEFLHDLSGVISFLYLDSHRLPIFSAEQYIEAELVPGAVVAIDDAHSFDNHKYGKATILVEIFNKYNIKWTLYDTEPGFKMVVARFPNGKKRRSVI